MMLLSIRSFLNSVLCLVDRWHNAQREVRTKTWRALVAAQQTCRVCVV